MVIKKPVEEWIAVQDAITDCVLNSRGINGTTRNVLVNFNFEISHEIFVVIKNEP